ncbi:hypothetical protein Btru_054739 [Bulinus truncatus]|nr:hypothetical protein Btru_054739 [Bulinus truncatus]
MWQQTLIGTFWSITEMTRRRRQQCTTSGMFVSHAKIRIIGLGGKSRKRRPHRRRLGVKEVVRMPCLLPTAVTVFLGLIAVAGGAGMSVIGYIPKTVKNLTESPDSANGSWFHLGLSKSGSDYAVNTCSYVGPVVMAVGLFSMIVACVFYCEILDKYAILVPDRRSAIYDKDELYEVIVGEMKKSYAQTLITAYSKAAERSLLADNQSSSGEYQPEPAYASKPKEPLTLEQQIDIECEGYTPSPPVPHKKYSVIQARIQRLRSEDNWLKTSSLPNIRRTASIKRVGRIGGKIKDSRTLSYDYTMDEARLRRKSMMLRSLVQWNSESSDMLANKQRRYSSVKALPSQRRGSWDAVSHAGFGSFPLTRLIQRRGTFACGDMKTRRMKFLLLLEASESQDAIPDSASVDGRATVAGIRRNSFIPYTTCDKFIADEAKRTMKDSRRPSVNPFSFTNRFNTTVPPPGARRHSFFPIRRDDKIFVSDVNEHRRHSFNPICVNNTLKPEYAANAEGRRASFNPDTLDKGSERRSSHIPSQNSKYLCVPGFETELYTERRPSTSEDTEEGNLDGSGVSDPCQFTGQVFQQDERRVERRHSSFNPIVVNVSPGGSESRTSIKVPKILINAELPSRFLTVPPQDYYMEERERRHSFNNTASTTKYNPPTAAASPKTIEKSPSQRISFKLSPEDSSSSISSSHQPIPKMNAKTQKAGAEPVRPSSFKQEMIVFKPLPRADSRSVSPLSNISCCGSERLGSDRSMNTSRTVSISSDRSVRTAISKSPSTVVSVEGVSPFGSFHPISPSEHSATTTLAADVIAMQISNIEDFEREHEILSADTSGVTNSFRNVRGRGRSRRFVVQADSPGSTSSGPATLTPSTITDANAAIQRSKSASSLPVVALSPQSPHIYARVPKPTSPLVSRHKAESGSEFDKNCS